MRGSKEADSASGVAHSCAVITGRYELGELIGRGGMGDVFAAQDLRLGRDVAVKLLRADLARDEAIRRRFEAEARTAARLAHPGIVAVFDTGDHDGVPYLVMERLPGRSLADEIARGPMDPSVVRTVAVQVLDALDAAHRAGVVHRDIKPSNVLEAGPQRWKVADFGIAKSFDGPQRDATTMGVILGTPRFVAPERLTGAPATPATDLYSVGALLYEAVTGRALFDHEVPVAAFVAAEPRPIHELRPDIDPELGAAIHRALAKDPSCRFPNAAAMADALNQPPATIGADVTVAMAAHAARPDETQALPQPPPVRAHPEPLRRRAHQRLLVLVAVALGIVFFALVATLGHHNARLAPTPTTAVHQPASPRGSLLPPALEQAFEHLEHEVQR